MGEHPEKADLALYSRLVELLTSTDGDDKASVDKVRIKYEAFLRILRVSLFDLYSLRQRRGF